MQLLTTNVPSGTFHILQSAGTRCVSRILTVCIGFTNGATNIGSSNVLTGGSFAATL